RRHRYSRRSARTPATRRAPAERPPRAPPARLRSSGGGDRAAGGRRVRERLRPRRPVSAPWGHGTATQGAYQVDAEGETTRLELRAEPLGGENLVLTREHAQVIVETGAIALGGEI